MRSLIIIEVEHGDDTDVLTDVLNTFENGSFEAWSGANVTDYTVRVDLPACFTLDG